MVVSGDAVDLLSQKVGKAEVKGCVSGNQLDGGLVNLRRSLYQARGMELVTHFRDGKGAVPAAVRLRLRASSARLENVREDRSRLQALVVAGQIGRIQRERSAGRALGFLKTPCDA